MVEIGNPPVTLSLELSRLGEESKHANSLDSELALDSESVLLEVQPRKKGRKVHILTSYEFEME